MIKQFFQWLKSFFSKKQKVVATIPKIVIPPLKPKETPKKIEAKEFIKPDDPNFRYGSSYLARLRASGL